MNRYLVKAVFPLKEEIACELRDPTYGTVVELINEFEKLNADPYNYHSATLVDLTQDLIAEFFNIVMGNKKAIDNLSEAEKKEFIKVLNAKMPTLTYSMIKDAYLQSFEKGDE